MSQATADKNQLTIGYWALRGLVEPSRLALHYTKTPYTEKLYVHGEGPEFSREEWLSEKQKLGLDFPNLPYLFHGDTKITQSKAILYYLGRKLNLLGKTPEEEAHVLMLCEEAHDFRSKLNGIFYGPAGESAEERKKFIQSTVAEDLKRFDDYLGKNSKFAVGDSPTVADFQLYEYLDAGLALDDEHVLIDKYTNIKRFFQTIRELPELKEYIAKAHAELPYNAKMAKFGGKVIQQK